MKTTKINITLIFIVLSVVLVCLMLLSLCVGAVFISPINIFKVIFSKDFNEPIKNIFLHVRLPRIFACIIAGISLALSGVILQSILNNPMASPSIIGVNAGSGFMVVCASVFFPTLLYLMPIFAFIGALIASSIVFFIAKKTGASRVAVILTGVAIASLFSAFSETLVTIFPDSVISRMDFMIGSFYGVTNSMVLFALPFALVAIFFVFLFYRELNVLTLGDSLAHSLGLNIKLYRGIFIVLSAVLAGVAISLAGLIGFVGLIIPNIVKMLVKQDHKILLPLCALMGAVFTLLCDTLSRVIIMPYEFPVGIIFSLLGVPFFLMLIIKKRTIKR